MYPETAIALLHAVERTAEALERIVERLDQLEARPDLVIRPLTRLEEDHES